MLWIKFGNFFSPLPPVRFIRFKKTPSALVRFTYIPPAPTVLQEGESHYYCFSILGGQVNDVNLLFSN